MLRSNDYNINTRSYWNDCYLDPVKRKEYFDEVPFSNDRFNGAVEFVKDGDKVLDMACGVGRLATLAKKLHPTCEVWGTDISNEVIEINRQSFPDIKWFYQKIGNQFELPNDYFDYIFNGETLEHMEHPEDIFIDAHRVLKKGGTLVITTPLRDWIHSPEHVWSFEPEDVEKLFKENGFEIDEVKVMEWGIIFGRGRKI